MDELIRTFQLGESVTPVVTVWTLILGTLLSAALSMGVALVYRQIHSETTYSQTFVHTMVLLCVIVCFIMLVIGSNIERAFSLVGALSIIRFRTAIRSPLDVGFLFFMMAIGMVSVHDVPDIEIEDSRFGTNYVGDDNLHLVRSSVVLRGNIFEGARADAVDLDQVEAKVIHCAFLDSGNDALDLSMSRVEIHDNLFARSGDKGISIGEGSRAHIERCQVEGNEIGVHVKDRSHADLVRNTFNGSRVAVYANMKKWRWEEGGTATIQETTFSGSAQADVSGDRKSRITFIGRRPRGMTVTGRVSVEERRAGRTP